MSEGMWLHRTYYLETLKVYAKVWDIYIKFYTVFLTANVLGLGLVIENMPTKRWPVCLAFICQNVVTIGTSFSVGLYSRKTDDKLIQIAKHLADANPVRRHSDVVTTTSPVARRLSSWAGYANCVATLCIIVCWIAVWRTPQQPETQKQQEIQAAPATHKSN